MTVAAVSWVRLGKTNCPHLAKEFINIPVVLSHPFNEVIELLDEITDLVDKNQLDSSEQCFSTYIVTAEVKTWGPRKD